jgi:hypothetical protein
MAAAPTVVMPAAAASATEVVDVDMAAAPPITAGVSPELVTPAAAAAATAATEDVDMEAPAVAAGAGLGGHNSSSNSGPASGGGANGVTHASPGVAAAMCGGQLAASSSSHHGVAALPGTQATAVEGLVAVSSSSTAPAPQKVPAWALQDRQSLCSCLRSYEEVVADGPPHELEWRGYLGDLLDTLAGEEHGLDYALLFTAIYNCSLQAPGHPGAAVQPAPGAAVRGGRRPVRRRAGGLRPPVQSRPRQRLWR